MIFFQKKKIENVPKEYFKKPSSISNTIKEPDYLPWVVVAKRSITKLVEII